MTQVVSTEAFLVLAGVLVMILALGALIALLSISVGPALLRGACPECDAAMHRGIRHG